MSGLVPPEGVDAVGLDTALMACEKVAAKDRSNLYVASQFFEDRTRYDAFIAMYAVMRLVDNFIDNVPDKARASKAVLDGLKAQLDQWEKRIRAAYAGRASSDPIDVGLTAAAQSFPVPIKAWLNFLDAMRFDVDHPRFADFSQFLEYGEGAAVAPTVIYVYLLTALKEADGIYRVKDFDFETCGRELGLFAYLAHILRDVKEDMAVGETGLVYLSQKDLADHGLDEGQLRRLLQAGQGDDRWHALVRELTARAHIMERRGISLAESRYAAMDRDCAFILRLIVTVYSELLLRIEASPDDVLRGNLMMRSQNVAVVAATVAQVVDGVIQDGR